jgi:hypothetical protein
MTLLGRGGAEVAEHVNAHGAGAAAARPITLDVLYEAGQRGFLTAADFMQRVPDFRFKPHAGSTALGGDVAVEKAAAHDIPQWLCSSGYAANS